MESAYDAVIVGSGFGGGIAACRLAEQGWRVCVLERGRRFGPGDFEEADDDVSHRPIVDSDVPCICIAAIEGKVKLEGFVGRLLQPFVRL